METLNFLKITPDDYDELFALVKMSACAEGNCYSGLTDEYIKNFIIATGKYAIIVRNEAGEMVGWYAMLTVSSRQIPWLRMLGTRPGDEETFNRILKKALNDLKISGESTCICRIKPGVSPWTAGLLMAAGFGVYVGHRDDYEFYRADLGNSLSLLDTLVKERA